MLLSIIIAMRRFNSLLFVPLLCAALIGCKTAPPAATTRFDPAKLHEIDDTVAKAIADHRLPGAVIWLERDGVAYHKAYGDRCLVHTEEPMTEDTVFDAASLTKVIATAPSIMILLERGLIDLDAPVQRYIEEFRRDGREAVTVRHLLTHTSGFRSGLGATRVTGRESAIQLACQEKLQNPPGSTFLYSDINFIMLGEIVRRVSSRPLERFAVEEIYWPLKMNDKRYLPMPDLRPRIAPTERDGTNWLRGIVHDPTARRMDGVAGHAGLFTTAADLARYARMMLNYGELDGVRILKPETVRLMTSVQSPPALDKRRGLGWDIDTGYSQPRGNLFPIGSYGHTGFTGTAIWIDPFSKTFWILLSNRVHPDGKGDVRALERALGTLAAQSVKGFDFEHVSGALAASTNQVTAAK